MVVGIETDRGLLVRALVAAGYRVLAVNPLAVDRYRDRHRVSGAKSDPGDARVLADMVRTDAHQHRPVAADSDLAEAIKLVARSHQSAIWSRRRLANQVRSALREYYPAALEAFDDLTHGDAVAVLAIAPTPEQGRRLSALEDRRGAAPRRPPAQHRHPRREDPDGPADRAPHPARGRGRRLRRHRRVTDARSSRPTPARSPSSRRSSPTISASTLTQRSSAACPASESSPAPGCSASSVTTPPATTTAKARRNYAGTSPLTVASGTRRIVRARHIRNRRLADALHWWAFNAITRSPGARALYDHRRAAGDTHSGALRVVANRLVAILHGCLRTHTTYDETTAWAHRHDLAA